MWRDHDTYRGTAEKRDEAEGQETAGAVDFDALLEKDLLCGQAGDAGYVTKEALNAARFF